MGVDLLQIINSFNLTNIFNSITSIFDWALAGITNILTSIVYFIQLIGSTITNLSIFSTTFGNILQSIFNVIPAFYLQIVVFTILSTIILQTIRRFI